MVSWYSGVLIVLVVCLNVGFVFLLGCGVISLILMGDCFLIVWFDWFLLWLVRLHFVFCGLLLIVGLLT